MILNNDEIKLEEDEIILLEEDEDEDEDILFIEDDTESSLETTDNKSWKVMIVDDEKTVHQATQLVLQDFTFDDKPVCLISAYSGKEAIELIKQHPDTAFILLDVVMESNDAGLKVVKYIREELRNKLVRIILRTGQPGEAPEESVIINYDINDYKLKVDLNRHRLITTTITALRGYRDVIALEQRTSELDEILNKLQQAQLQMVQNEKMATLGNLVAGVAHEVNNPIGFLKGSIRNAEEYIQDLFAHIECYQENYPNPKEEVNEHAEDIDLEYLSGDLPKLLNSMTLATERITNISNSLRTFSRADTSEKVACNIHEGINSTILILKYRLKANDKRPAIEIIKEYGELPLIKCFLGQLNQVFMNIIANAIDAVDTVSQGKNFSEIEANPYKITIKTEVCKDADTVLFSIKDNASGMPESVKKRVFDNLFTTKGVGKGTGLGLAIAKQIIEETHNGKLSCNSTLGKGTEFRIELPIL
ncbi:response regulator receiver sensor signal transduction histidine kinase [Calothrix parasitica NIES-267]|uniref:histidine kinase n=1 Tax=Calothrix parasitica NIES-267 TaxID=1973488 RepID=A0A1Z4LMJ3_9CYAN|nr:response regulator receiver sensor signal transduction histidine kinase [Calothrix parasitica NIES-267]